MDEDFVLGMLFGCLIGFIVGCLIVGFSLHYMEIKPQNEVIEKGICPDNTMFKWIEKDKADNPVVVCENNFIEEDYDGIRIRVLDVD